MTHPVLIIKGFTALSSVTIQVWQVLEKRRKDDLDLEYNREKDRLDRELMLEMLKAQHNHELKLAGAKEKEPNVTYFSVPLEKSVELDTNDPLLARLQVEAEKLSRLGFDVAYECIDDNYGLALPMGDSLTFCFFIPVGYPNQAPIVLLRTDDKLEQIPFEPGAWQPDIMIADIVIEIVSALVAEPDM